MEDFQVFILQTKSSLSLVFIVPNMEKVMVENSEKSGSFSEIIVWNSEKSVDFSEQFLKFSIKKCFSGVVGKLIYIFVQICFSSGDRIGQSDVACRQKNYLTFF